MSLEGKDRKELFEIWKKRVRIAKAVHQEKVVDWASKIIKEYAGDALVNLDTGERYSQVSHIMLSIEETILPHLYFNNPTFHAKAKETKSAWERRQEEVAAIVNHEYQDVLDSGHGIELENELAMLDARLLPYGVTKVSWEAKGDILKEESEDGNVIESPLIEKERMVIERLNPLKVILDWTADHITKQRFHIEAIDSTREELRKSRYDQEIIDKLKPGVSTIPDSVSKRINFISGDERERFGEDPDLKAYRLYEIHDLENRVIHTIIDGGEDFIEFNSQAQISESSQYQFIWFIEKPNDPYPIPPVKAYRSRAYEMAYAYSQISEQIDKFMPKVLINIDNLDKPEQERFKSGHLGALIAAKGNLSNAVQEINLRIQQDLVNYLALLKDLLNMESGVSEYEISIPEKRKATEAALIAKGVKSRRFKPQKRVKAFLINQAQAIYKIKKRNAPIEHFISILGEEKAREWWEDPETGKSQWTDENLGGDFWFTYDVESVQPQDEAVRRQQNIEALSSVLNPDLKIALAEEKKRLLVSPIAEKFVKENLSIRDTSKVIEDMKILDPEQEHDLWMQGQYPPITEDEARNEEMLMNHFTKHSLWTSSPAFNFLPDPIQMGAMNHLNSYLPFIQKIQAKRQQPNPSQATGSRTPLPVSNEDKFLQEAV